MEFTGQFIASYNLTNDLDTLLLQLGSWYYPLTVHELDNFDPQYTLDRHGITRDDEKAADLVIEDVRYLYECAFGMRVKNNSSYADGNVLEWKLKEMKNGLQYTPPKLIARSNRSHSVASNASDNEMSDIEGDQKNEKYQQKKKEVMGNSLKA